MAKKEMPPAFLANIKKKADASLPPKGKSDAEDLKAAKGKEAPKTPAKPAKAPAKKK